MLFPSFLLIPLRANRYPTHNCKALQSYTTLEVKFGSQHLGGLKGELRPELPVTLILFIVTKDQ